MSRRRQIEAQEMFSRAFFFSIRWFCILAVLLIQSGCTKNIPEGKDAIDDVTLIGAPRHTQEALIKGLATQASPKFLGVRGVYDWQTFDEASLEKDILRIERQLRRHGYYQARVTAARVIHQEENHLRVELRIDPGRPVIIRKLETTGLAALPFDAAERAAHENRLRVGKIFNEDEYEGAKQDVANALADEGYAFARVKGHATVDLAANSAEVKISADPGKRASLGAINIEGLTKLEESAVRSVLGLEEGDRYSRNELQVARAALIELGVFSRVEIVQHRDKPESGLVPLTIRLEESTFKKVTLGAGARLDLLRLAVVGQAGWSHRNFLGGLRQLSLTTKPGLTFYPTTVDNLRAPTNAFPENFFKARLEQPAFIESRTRGFVEAGYNIYPLLYPLPVDTDPRLERVVGYQEITNSVGLERSFFGQLLPTTLSFNVQVNLPMNYQQGDPTAEYPDIGNVIVTYPELYNRIDLRDDPIFPTQGALISNSLQVAVPFVKEEVSDVRIHPEIRAFVPLDNSHRLVLATRVGVGMVFPHNYGDTRGVDDQHKFLFRAFYSGGPGSNRGYPYRRIGPQGEISFLVPNGANCDPTMGMVDSSCIRPLGGLTMWEASAELRLQVGNSWRFVGFIDSSDVNLGVAEFTFYKPHISIGPGVRYVSPVGPIRLDVAWRVPGLQNLNTEPDDPPDIADVPPYNDQKTGLAVHILIGEDF